MSATPHAGPDLDDSWRSLPVIDTPPPGTKKTSDLDDSWFDLPIIELPAPIAKPEPDLKDPWFI